MQPKIVAVHLTCGAFFNILRMLLAVKGFGNIKSLPFNLCHLMSTSKHYKSVSFNIN